MTHARLAPWRDALPKLIAEQLHPSKHGKMEEWQVALAALPMIRPSTLNLQTGVQIGIPDDISETQRQQMVTQLKLLHPWRKGPFDLFGTHIDTEWRSDWKWDRVKDVIQPLNGRSVLDVGCGNGYFGWRMVGAGARLVVGLDPFLAFVMQYHAICHFINQDVAGQLPSYVLPLGIEALPSNLRAFDTVFSMGVLYHRRSPFDHLFTLRDALRPGGELVLETLIIEGKDGNLSLGEALVPEGRYAQMRNVWFLPTVDTLISWLRKCHFMNITLLDVTPTSIKEQRSTDWMTFQSLSDYLDPQDPTKTIEGHPAPKRVVITAVSP